MPAAQWPRSCPPAHMSQGPERAEGEEAAWRQVEIHLQTQGVRAPHPAPADGFPEGTEVRPPAARGIPLRPSRLAPGEGQPRVRGGGRCRARRLPLPGDEVDVVPQSRVVSGHVLCGSVLAGAVRFGGVRFCQRPQADQQRQGESQHRHPQPHGALHLDGERGRAAVRALLDGRAARPPPARSSATPGPGPVPVPTPSRYSRWRLQRSGSGRGLALPARGSGLPSAGLRASPGCFKASPAGRRGLGRSRLASPGPPPAKPPPAPCPGRGTGRGRAPPPSPASRAPARGQIPLGGTLRARGSPMWLSESGGGGGTGVGGGVPRSCGIGPSLDLLSGSAVRLNAKEEWKKVLRRFGESRNVKSVPQARALPPLNKYTSRVTCPGN